MTQEHHNTAWIQVNGPPDRSEDDLRDATGGLYARTQVEIPDEVASAVVQCASDGPYVLFVNGRYVGRGPCESETRRCYVDAYDLVSYVHPGTNTIAVRVQGSGGLRVEGEIVCRDGVHVPLTTDRSWRVRSADAWSDADIYDARRAPAGWIRPDFDDAKWTPAVTATNSAVLVPRDIPMLREAERLAVRVTEIGRCPSGRPSLSPSLLERMRQEKPVTAQPGDVRDPNALLGRGDRSAVLRASRSGPGIYLLLDFGREMVGFPHLALEGGGGGIVDLGYGETRARSEIARAERYIMREGVQEWEGLSRQAFRYIHLIFRQCTRRVKVNGIGVNTTAYPADPRGHFSCSDEQLNRIWTAGQQTIQLCMQDAYLDAPITPRTFRWGDIRIQALTNYYAFGDYALMGRELRRFGSRLEEASETTLDHTPSWILALGEAHLYSGDRHLLRACYPAMVQALDRIEAGRTGDGLLEDMSEASIDHADLSPRDRRIALTCLYYGALRSAGALAGVLGETVQANTWASTAETLRRELIPRFHQEEPPHVALSAILFEVVEEALRFQLLFQSLRGERVDRIDTPRLTFDLIDMLYRSGQSNRAIGLIRDRWGKMTVGETTTCWEDFEGRGRRCYGASASPTYFLSSRVLGVMPETPGWRRTRVAPDPSELTWAKGSVPLRYGDLGVAWQREEDDQSFEMNVEIPEGSAVEIGIPRLRMKLPTVELNGQTLWRNEKLRPVDLVREATSDRAYIRFLLDRPGAYRFTAFRG